MSSSWVVRMHSQLQREVLPVHARRQISLSRTKVSLPAFHRSWHLCSKPYGAGRGVGCRYSEQAEPDTRSEEQEDFKRPRADLRPGRAPSGQMYGGTVSTPLSESTSSLPADTRSSIVTFRRSQHPPEHKGKRSILQPGDEHVQSEGRPVNAPSSTGSPADNDAQQSPDASQQAAQARRQQQKRRRHVLAERKAVLTNQWYNIGICDQVKDKPVQTTLCGKQLVLYRGHEGRLHCLSDECPHRAAPLSQGRVETIDGQACVVCPYHDWAFSGDGALRDVPAQRNDLCRWSHCKAEVKAFDVQEKGGFIWLFWGKLPVHERPPIPFVPELVDRSWRPVYGSIEFDCPHWGVFENAIDVAHIHSLHTSDFGNQERPEIQIIHDPAVRRDEPYGVTMKFALHNKATNPVWRLFQVDEVIVTAEALLPSTSVISFTLGSGLSFITFVNTVPISATRSINRFALIRKLNVDPIGAAFFNWPAWDMIARKAMLKILGEDKVMVEQLRPEALLLEHSVPADELQLAFRSKRAKFARDLVALEEAERIFEDL